MKRLQKAGWAIVSFVPLVVIAVGIGVATVGGLMLNASALLFKRSVEPWRSLDSKD